MTWIKKVFRVESAVPILSIILGFVSSVGLIDSFFPPEKVLVAIVTLISTQLLIERFGIMEKILDKINTNQVNPDVIELKSRNDGSFEDFPKFTDKAEEIMVIGVDLGFMAKASAWYLKNSIDDGLDLKIIMTDPDKDLVLNDCLNLHDERNNSDTVVHNHITSARDVIEVLKAMPSKDSRGRIEIRGRKGIPAPSVTLVNPKNENGKIRVEIKLYKRNQGDVPYFLLNKKNKIYNLFYKNYYEKLWNDSHVIFKYPQNPF